MRLIVPLLAVCVCAHAKMRRPAKIRRPVPTDARRIQSKSKSKSKSSKNPTGTTSNSNDATEHADLNYTINDVALGRDASSSYRNNINSDTYIDIDTEISNPNIRLNDATDISIDVSKFDESHGNDECGDGTKSWRGECKLKRGQICKSHSDCAGPEFMEEETHGAQEFSACGYKFHDSSERICCYSHETVKARYFYQFCVNHVPVDGGCWRTEQCNGHLRNNFCGGKNMFTPGTCLTKLEKGSACEEHTDCINDCEKKGWFNLLGSKQCT